MIQTFAKESKMYIYGIWTQRVKQMCLDFS